MCNGNPQNRDFKGVWISRDIYLNPDLSWTEKILLVEIDSLDHGPGCYASNSYLSQFLQVSGDWIKHLLADMKSRGFITVAYSDGHRYIKLSKSTDQHKHRSDPDPEAEADEVEVPPGSEISLTGAQESDVETVYEFWNSYNGKGNGRWHNHTKISYTIRLAVSTAMKTHSVESICQAIENYASILQSDDCYWTYQYTLDRFLSAERSDGKKWVDFLPGNFDKSAYAGRKSDDKQKSPAVPEDQNPEITGRLIMMYRNLANSQRFEPNDKQKAQFIDASAKLVEYFRPYPMVKGLERLKILRQVLVDKYVEKGEILNVGNFCSKYTWDTLVPQLMREYGHIE